MHSDNSYIKVIFKDISFSKKEIGIIESVFHKVALKKGTFILKPGDIADAQYYIFEGCLRSFYVDRHGKEHTVQFGISDWWISDYTSFFSNTKAIMHIEVIQDAIVYKISREDKEFLYSHVPKVESFFRVKLERAFAAFQRRILSGLSLTAKERYLRFISRYPNIEKSVKNYHIASYLGITTQSLSRIRKELIHK